MTLTITLTPEQEARVRQEARQHGLEAEEYALKLLLGELPALAAPKRRVLTGYGKYSRIAVSSADVRRDRQADLMRENR
jgi:hypothetical protein